MANCWSPCRPTNGSGVSTTSRWTTSGATPRGCSGNGSRRRASAIERLTYCISLLLPAAAALRLSERLRKPKHRAAGRADRTAASLDRLCLATVQLEASLLRYINLPTGVSVVCLARRA
ncbi:MAG: hypothetical protein M5U09_23240 [Gammaproteobacteria bacterium]|nr:hypothetical protein [Gammaproteobacteria bacterium]